MHLRKASVNSNRQKFWTIADEADWITAADAAAVDFDTATQRLRLRARLDAALTGTVDSAASADSLSQPSMAVDAFGTTAFWDSASKSVVANGALGGSAAAVALCGPLTDVTVCDMALGFDDVLYVSLRETAGLQRTYLRFIDRRGRWSAPMDAVPGTLRADLHLSTMAADRLAADPAGGVWLLDRANRAIGRVQGYPLADHLPGDFADTVFRPMEENPNLPRVARDALPAIVGERLIAIACSPDGRLALLSWNGAGETLVRLREADGQWRSADPLVNAGQPASLAWMSAHQLAVIPAARTPKPSADEALVYELEYAAAEKRFKPVPAGGYYPLLKISQRLFAGSVTLPPRYPVITGQPARLLPMSLAAFHAAGEAQARVLDAGADAVVWHRLYLEAVLPPGCGLTVMLAATDDPQPMAEDLAWHPHYFGAAEAADMVSGAPARGVWLPQPSEIPHHAGLLGCEPLRDQRGLFTVLIQRPGLKVRSLAGRYLHLRIVLKGRGHLTPEIAAIRVYAPRFSYRDHYLPELYREEMFGADAEANGSATAADFLGRFLDLFEGVLTPLEDRVAAAHILTDPHSAPPEALAWLGEWIGVLFDPAFPQDRRRAWIEAAHRLYRTRGTLAGLQLALEIATGGRLSRRMVNGREVESPQGGAVTGGRVLVIEDFRLRRTFATILGADLSVADDPLLPGGLLSSANSHVGDTLILGEESKKEFLALFSHAFSAEKPQKAAEEKAVFDLYDKLAYRVTVLVHNEVSPVDMGLLRRIAAQEAPAHVDCRVVSATWPLLVGLASLVEVDTYLTPRPPRGVARVDESRLGENAFIRRVPALDPRLTH
jgi:phage tail-like protein